MARLSLALVAYGEGVQLIFLLIDEDGTSRAFVIISTFFYFNNYCCYKILLLSFSSHY
jgi:hypothetical protein